jgi:hypothetical protein
VLNPKPIACALVLAAGLSGCGHGNPAAPTAAGQRATPPPAAPPPGSPYAADGTLTGVTLFGVVFETTPAGPAPISGVTVYCDACGELGHTWMRTDGNGYYSFPGSLETGGGIWLSRDTTALWVVREGYQDPPGLVRLSPLPSGPGWRNVRIAGDTRFDVELVRQ